MPDFSHPITFAQLLREYPRIEVPLIQRDYAQGRETEKDVRDEFLKALHGALSLPPLHPTLPLNLDFVYGSMEGGKLGSFLPLDGQQRLTTLFLLHWYTAWCDGLHGEFEKMLWDGKHSRFTYAVRPSSTEFFDQFVRFVPHATPDKVPSIRNLIEDQPWYFLHWRLDPTIQSVLVMLDALHEGFRSECGLFSRMVDDEHPAITFELLPLEHFGLTDDLYIKMNARGKPLTSFETFKARFEELLAGLFPTETRQLGGSEVSIAAFFERRIDTQWTDFFWAHKSPQTNTFDDLIMNLLLALARVSLEPTSSRFNQDTTLLRDRQLVGSFPLFHDNGWLTPEFATNLIHLLEAWSRGSGTLLPILPNNRFFDEISFFQKAIRDPAAIDYTQLVQFAAFVLYLNYHGDNVNSAMLNEWMRVVRNLSMNSEIERPEEYGRSLSGLQKLLPYSADILERFSDTEVGQIGFSPQQVREEALKASLILADVGWRERILGAEEHGYFSGQIEFLLEFCGVLAQVEKIPSKWNSTEHAQLQAAFDEYFSKVQICFSASGLAYTKQNLWKRALLAVGDYLPSSGSNYSFLTDPQRSWDSWKRFLRGGTRGTRQFLKDLWDRIDANAPIEPQLAKIIASASGVEPWRAAIIKHPGVITYCGQQEMRRGWNADEMYLLRKKQMNGYHAELFSYALHLELADAGSPHDLTPLTLQRYQDVSMTEMEPYVHLVFERSNRRVNLCIESSKGQFRIYTRTSGLIEVPDVETALCGEAAFLKGDDNLVRLVPREDVHQALQQIAASLAKLPKP